jgi:hypothetical protein
MRILGLPRTVPGVTTVLDEGDALVVRCDSCRRLWPIKREWLDRVDWVVDHDEDHHTCPVCAPELVEPAI